MKAHLMNALIEETQKEICQARRAVALATGADTDKEGSKLSEDDQQAYCDAINGLNKMNLHIYAKMGNKNMPSKTYVLSKKREEEDKVVALCPPKSFNLKAHKETIVSEMLGSMSRVKTLVAKFNDKDNAREYKKWIIATTNQVLTPAPSYFKDHKKVAAAMDTIVGRLEEIVGIYFPAEEEAGE